MIKSIIAPPKPAVNWCAVRAWAELRWPDAYLNFDQFKHYYFRQFLVSQRVVGVAQS